MSTGGDADLPGHSPRDPSSRNMTAPSPPFSRSRPFIPSSNVARKDPGALAASGLIRGSKIMQHAPRPAYNVDGSSLVVANPARRDAWPARHAHARQESPWEAFSRLLPHHRSKRVGPGRASTVASGEKGGGRGIWHGSTHSHTHAHTHSRYTKGRKFPVQCFRIVHYTSPPHVQAGPPDRNEYPVQVQPRADESHVLTAARSADMMNQLKAGRGCEGGVGGEA